jgi:hypothetical protein
MSVIQIKIDRNLMIKMMINIEWGGKKKRNKNIKLTLILFKTLKANQTITRSHYYFSFNFSSSIGFFILNLLIYFFVIIVYLLY